MIEVTSHRLKEFTSLNLVGVGGISVVFSATHLAEFNSFGQDRKVALKFVWDVAQAQAEVRRLIQLESNRGVNKLYGYFEAPTEEVMELLAPLLNARQAHVSPPQAESGDAQVGILVMQLSHGQHLMKTWAMESASYKLKRDEWVIDFEGKPFIQALALPLALDERIAIIRSLFKVLIEAHEQSPPQVHGDLHPGNVHYNPKTGEVVILDWSGMDIYGAAGWITPWHDQKILGEIQNLPGQADVYMIALWIERLLGNEAPQYRKLAETVLASEHKCPDIHSFFNSFENIVKALKQSGRNKRWIYWAVVAVLVIGVVRWRAIIADQERRHNQEMSELLNRGEKDGKVMYVLETKKDNPAYVKVWGDVDTIKKAIEMKYAEANTYLQKYELRRPQAVFISSSERMIIYGGLPFVEGDLINNESVITSIGLGKIHVRHVESGAGQELKFFAHPLLRGAPPPSNGFLVYSTHFRDIANAMSRYLKEDIVLQSASEPVALAFVRGEDPRQLLPRMFGVEKRTASATERRNIYYDGQWIRYWDLEPGLKLEGRFGQLASKYLEKRMGYRITKMSAKLRAIPMICEVAETRSCLSVFEQEAAAHGYALEVDHTGNQIAFRKLK